MPYCLVISFLVLRFRVSLIGIGGSGNRYVSVLGCGIPGLELELDPMRSDYCIYIEPWWVEKSIVYYYL